MMLNLHWPNTIRYSMRNKNPLLLQMQSPQHKSHTHSIAPQNTSLLHT